MTIIAAPGATIRASTQWSVSGLVGTIRVRVRNTATSVDVLAASTSGIVEDPAGSGVYVATLVTPVIATGTSAAYSIEFDDGVIAPGHVSVEELVVTSSAASVGTPSGYDLLTLADAKSWLRIPVTTSRYDTLLGALITSASKRAESHTGHRFERETQATHTFRYDGSALLDLAPYDLDPAGAIAISVDTDFAPYTLQSAMYRYEPRSLPFGIATHVDLAAYTPARSSVNFWGGGAVNAFGRQVAVTGNWGWPSIPADLAQGALLLVASWWSNPRQVQAVADGSVNETFSPKSSDMGLAKTVKELWEPYRRPAWG